MREREGVREREREKVRERDRKKEGLKERGSMIKEGRET